MYWNLLKPILIRIANETFEAPETKCRAEKQSERKRFYGVDKVQLCSVHKEKILSMKILANYTASQVEKVMHCAQKH